MWSILITPPPNPRKARSGYIASVKWNGSAPAAGCAAGIRLMYTQRDKPSGIVITMRRSEKAGCNITAMRTNVRPFLVQALLRPMSAPGRIGAIRTITRRVMSSAAWGRIREVVPRFRK